MSGVQPIPLTDELVQEARAMIGKEVVRAKPGNQWNEEASHDAIRHYAHGIGDENPLWCSRDYGKKSPYGCTIAPPTFLHTVDTTIVAPGLGGIQLIFGGTDWTFYDVARAGDGITPCVRIVDVEEHRGKKVERFLIQVGEVTYTRQDGKLLARALGRTLRIPRVGAEGHMRQEARRQTYTEEQLEAIRQDVLREEMRGSKTRFWEEVNAGDLITPVVKGPLNLVDMVCYMAGLGYPTPFKALERSYLDPYKGDKMFYRNAQGELINAAVGHLDERVAREIIGMPGAYDVGHQRISWMGHLLTNWMGDDGFLKRLQVKIERPNLFGDTTWCRGRITGKRKEGSECLVDCELWTENQRKETTVTGTATVGLHSRES